MPKHRTGHIPDHPEVVKKRVAIHHAPMFAAIMAVVPSLPMQTTNRAKLMPQFGGPGILNQTDTGSCEGHAHASGGTLRLAIMGQSQGLVDPVMLYLGALLIDRTLNPDGTLSTVTDAGTMPQSILSAWATYGAQLASTDAAQYPASSKTLYQNPSDPNSPLVLPAPEKLEKGSPYRYKNAYFVTAAGPARVLQLMAILASGRPVSDAIPASGDQFQNYTGGVLGTLDGPVDHANLIVDYVWTGTQAQLTQFTTAMVQSDVSTFNSLAKYLNLVGDNSWGTDWGQADVVSGATGGTYLGDINYLNGAEDLCALDLEAA